MIFSFIPKEFNFFDLFDKQVDQSVEAARFFKALVLKTELMRPQWKRSRT